MSYCSPWARIVICSVLCLISSIDVAEAQDRAGGGARQKVKFAGEVGTIEGAVWTFELKSKTGPQKNIGTVRGRYRVFDLKFYQAETKGGEMTKEIGVSKPNGDQNKTTIAEYESLKGSTGSNQITELKG